MPVKIISTDPPVVTENDLEDFLATDNLFIEYFNLFLSLPTFPEPLCFNKDRGGFEVVTDAKKELTGKLRSLIQANRRQDPIYKAATTIANANKTPKLNYGDNSNEDFQIKTSFSVQCLNKEQGIGWIKKERLPMFLQSDLYLEYRLAKLISQTEVAGNAESQPLNMTIDDNHKPFVVEKPVIEEPPPVDENKVIMKDLYVCLGNTSTTDSEQWFSTVKMARGTSTTSSTGPRTTSSLTSIRPLSTASLLSDSGYGTTSSQHRDSPDLTNYGLVDDEEVYRSKLFNLKQRPATATTWKAPVGEDVCVVAENERTSTDYSQPAYNSTPESKSVMASSSNIDSGNEADEENSTGSKKPIVVQNLEELSKIVVAVAVKSAYMDLTDLEDAEIDTIIDNQVLKSKNFKSFELKRDLLDYVAINDFGDIESDETDESDDDDNSQDSEMIDRPSKSKQKVKFENNENKDSDEDTLFGSDLEDKSDTFFSKRKRLDLTKMKGLLAFKDFLKGTIGELDWNFWLDVDRCAAVAEEDVQQEFIAQMREKYKRKNAICELPFEVLVHLGLSENSKWTLQKLLAAQKKIINPLLLYWGPRFLMAQNNNSKVTENNYLYQRQKVLRPKTAAHPNPKTITLLPLRPKSCRPRISTANNTINKDTQKIKTVSKKVEVQEVTKNADDSDFTILPIVEKSAETKIPSPTKEPENTAETKLGQAVTSLPVTNTRMRPNSATPNLHNFGNNALVPSPPKRVYRARLLSNRTALCDKLSTKKASESKYHTCSSAPAMRRQLTSANSLESSQDSFFGSPLMEELLRGLHNEKKSGGFFMKFLEKSRNSVWLNCLNCWHNLQDYHLRFYDKRFNEYDVAQKAKIIHSRYIVIGSRFNINCPMEIRKQVFHEIDPPFEELFDSSEELILQTLVAPWSLMAASDKSLYRKIELVEEERKIPPLKTKHLKTLQKKGLIKKMSIADLFADEEAKKEAYYEALLDKVPDEFKDVSLLSIVRNRTELEHFRNFLADNYASIDLDCWLDIEQFRRTPHSATEKRDEKAKDIKLKYLNKKYFFGPNSPASKEGQNQVMQAGGGWGKLLQDRPPTASIIEAQKFVLERLERKWLPMFLSTEEYQERQRPEVKMVDVVDDVVRAKSHRQRAVWKMLESRWVSSSRDIITFRKALMNPVTCDHFRRFVSIRGENLGNDVLFWLEVQRFKDLCHTHAEDAIVNSKIETITRSFIRSDIPPELQIDITQEQADKILEKRPRERGPYIFREAQLTVFRMLYSHFAEFCNYRNSVGQQKVVEELEKRQMRHIIKERRKQKQLERKEALDMLLRKDGDEEDEGPPRPASTSTNDLPDFLREDEEPIQKVQWKYSSYIKALSREEALMQADNISVSFSTEGSIKSNSDTWWDPKAQERAAAAAAERKQRKSNLHKSSMNKKRNTITISGEESTSEEKSRPTSAKNKIEKEKKSSMISSKSSITKQPVLSAKKRSNIQ